MVQSINNLAQQSIASPLQQRGDQQQQQINQRQQNDDTAVTSRNSQTTETRRSGTNAAQSQGANAQTNREPTELSVSQAREQFGEGRPERGSFVDITA